MAFVPNRKFRREYDRLFKRDPLLANTFLLLSELADSDGNVRLGQNPEEEIQRLLGARFEDPKEYAL